MLAAGCASRRGKVVEALDKDNGNAFRLMLSDTLCIRLAENPTTGYSWTVNRHDSSMLRIVRKEYQIEKNRETLVGAGGEMLMWFVPLQKGSTTLRLIYHRSWEKEIPPVQTFEIDLEISK